MALLRSRSPQAPSSSRPDHVPVRRGVCAWAVPGNANGKPGSDWIGVLPAALEAGRCGCRRQPWLYQVWHPAQLVGAPAAAAGRLLRVRLVQGCLNVLAWRRPIDMPSRQGLLPLQGWAKADCSRILRGVQFALKAGVIQRCDDSCLQKR